MFVPKGCVLLTAAVDRLAEARRTAGQANDDGKNAAREELRKELYGRSMLAMAVSSEAIASAVKIAAIAHRRRSGGKPSITGAAGAFTVASMWSRVSAPVRSRWRLERHVLRSRRVPQPQACMMPMRIPLLPAAFPPPTFD